MNKTVTSKITGIEIYLCDDADIEIYESNKDQSLFMMDGSLHFEQEKTNCCGNFGKTCECGGYMHYQPVYGGFYYKCEKCLEED